MNAGIITSEHFAATEVIIDSGTDYYYEWLLKLLAKKVVGEQHNHKDSKNHSRLFIKK